MNCGQGVHVSHHLHPHSTRTVAASDFLVYPGFRHSSLRTVMSLRPELPDAGYHKEIFFQAIPYKMTFSVILVVVLERTVECTWMCAINERIASLVVGLGSYSRSERLLTAQ